MATKRSTRKTAGAPLTADSTASEVVAHEILVEFSDLAPSVNKIMNAGLAEPAQLHAITLFRESLGTPTDSMRDPQNAIAAGQALVTDQS